MHCAVSRPSDTHTRTQPGFHTHAFPGLIAFIASTCAAAEMSIAFLEPHLPIAIILYQAHFCQNGGRVFHRPALSLLSLKEHSSYHLIDLWIDAEGVMQCARLRQEGRSQLLEIGERERSIGLECTHTRLRSLLGCLATSPSRSFFCGRTKCTGTARQRC